MAAGAAGEALGGSGRGGSRGRRGQAARPRGAAGRAEPGSFGQEPRGWAAAWDLMLRLRGGTAGAWGLRAVGQEHRSPSLSPPQVAEAGQQRRAGRGPAAGRSLARLIFPGGLSGPGGSWAGRAPRAAQL